MKPLIKHAILIFSLITFLALSVNSAHADYYVVYVKYQSCGVTRIADYKRKTLKAARSTQETFRRIPKYRNAWIKFVKEK